MVLFRRLQYAKIVGFGINKSEDGCARVSTRRRVEWIVLFILWFFFFVENAKQIRVDCIGRQIAAGNAGTNVRKDKTKQMSIRVA